MPTSVHIPKPLLDAVDRRARALGTSRNRLIIAALEKETQNANGWPPGFFERLAGVSKEAAREFEESMAVVRKMRRSKKAPPF